MHFPTLDQLLLDATVGALSTAAVEDALRSDSDDPGARVDALVEALTRTADETLPLGRKIIALTVDAPDTGPQPRRGQRRTEWIDTALAPLREHVTDEQYERLVAGLSVVVGWEAMIITRDVCGLDARREAQILRWAAATLVRAILAE